MSAQVGSVCYGSDLAAALASASGFGGAVVGGSPAAVVEVGSVTASSIGYVLHPVDGSAAVTVAVPFSPVPCQLPDAGDGALLGWLVGGAWLAVYGVRVILRGLFGERGGDDVHS